MAKIFHASLHGLSKAKDLALLNSDIDKTKWSAIDIETSSFYLLIPQNYEIQREYEPFWKITDIFGTASLKADSGKRYGLGVCTHNDQLFVGWSLEEVEARVTALANLEISDKEILATLPIEESPYWNTYRERGKVRGSNWQEKFLRVYYRPFDWRTIYYEPSLMEIGRGGASRRVMAHAQHSSLNLLVSRGYEIASFEHALVCDSVAVHHAATRKEGCYLFPLYLGINKSEEQQGFLKEETSINFSQPFLEEITTRLGYTPTPEAIFYYIYAILYSPTYRTRYAEFLKGDFPRIPLTRNVDLFRQLGELGEQLINLHLMKSPILNQTSSPFDNGGSCIVEHPPKYENGKVVINKQKGGFMNVSESVWNFHVGGYQVCHKWLKDRKGRTLSPEDIQHYQKIVVALGQTIDLMAKIDIAIPNWPIDAEYN